MPQNVNPWVAELLSWHGHDRGGVHVPFQVRRNKPIKTIETGLVKRLRSLARSIAAGNTKEPRWIFLIGGPGNGKSETVQDFLGHLDEELGMQGELVKFLENEFVPQPVIKRRISVLSKDIAAAPGIFKDRVGRLVVIQDATATEDALGNAAQQLCYDIADLLQDSGEISPIFVVCANRGLLTRALKDAYEMWGKENSVVQLLTELIKVSSLGIEALADQPHSCWPLELKELKINARVACWPLDFESLLVQTGDVEAPVRQILHVATEYEKWEISSRCNDCTSRGCCPFRQNAEWLRDNSNVSNLEVILRHGELAIGQRWNFRDTFSLIAEIMVGQWSDFKDLGQPCTWVHKQVDNLQNSTNHFAVGPLYALVRRLYPHALFQKELWRELAGIYRDDPKIPGQERSRALIRVLTDDEPSSSKPIREKLLEDYSRLDSAIFTPADPSHLLREIEENYSQSVELGRIEAERCGLAALEVLFLNLLDKTEQEWYPDSLENRAHLAARFTRFLRSLAAVISKRSIGTRRGYHANQQYLTDYEEALHDPGKLRQLSEAMRPLLGGEKFRFNLVESFGQPRADKGNLITLEGDVPGLRFVAAPRGNEQYPGHDIPRLVISGMNYHIAITFEFFLALCLRREGCASSSLPASVRASVDRIRHLYAGELCRNKEKFIDSTARILIGEKFSIELSESDADPTASRLGGAER